MKRFITAILACIILFITLGASAEASSGNNCGGWTATNRNGDLGWVHDVKPMRGMNCASSRYVVNKWLKRGYQRQYSNVLPTHFFDGYVTWHCRPTSYSGHAWRCDEYTSNTAFRFQGDYFG